MLHVLEIYHIVSQKQFRNDDKPDDNKQFNNTQTIQVAPTTEQDKGKKLNCCQ